MKKIYATITSLFVLFLLSSTTLFAQDLIDITDLGDVEFIGSHQDSVWVNGGSGSGSPEAEALPFLFDKDTETKYLVRTYNDQSWFEIHTNTETIVTKYIISSANDNPDRDPKNWNLEGLDESTDEWIVIDEIEDNLPWEDFFTPRTFEFDNDQAFSSYRFSILAINGSEQHLMQISEMEIYGTIPTSAKEINEAQISINYNSNSHLLNINSSSQLKSIMIYDIAGRMVSQTQLNAEFNKSINVSDLNLGVYILKTEAISGKVNVSKFCKN